MLLAFLVNISGLATSMFGPMLNPSTTTPSFSVIMTYNVAIYFYLLYAKSIRTEYTLL